MHRLGVLLELGMAANLSVITNRLFAHENFADAIPPIDSGRELF
jgi:hypothetical protein